MSGLLSLISKLEQATGPSRELDCEIALDAADAAALTFDAGGEFLCKIGDVWGIVPRYTDSIDAALTVRPTGYHYDINDSAAVGVRISAPGFDHHRHYRARHTLVPISVCIASLKALHHSKGAAS